jgi:UDP-N-acetylmuramoylalanine--D-glutamate ligase
MENKTGQKLMYADDMRFASEPSLCFDTASRSSAFLARLRSVCVLGGGVTGEAVMAFFRSLPSPPEIALFTDDAEVSGHYDLAVVSPGIPPHSPLVVSARRQAAELISEPELAYRLSPLNWTVVTGTNGKTTTTALAAHLLNSCGLKARVAGNIGTACIEAVCQRQAGEHIVAELSSYQLEYSSTIAPDAAILLNITPDHLSWHGSFESYRQAKLSLFERMGQDAPAVIDATLEQTRAVVRSRRDLGLRVIPLGTREGLESDMTELCQAPEAAFVDAVSQRLCFVIAGQRLELLPTSELNIKGQHNQANALAAAAAVLALGGDPERVSAGLASFQPLEHRIEPVGTVGAVGFFNDSKATNPEASCKALAAFGDTRLVLMLGGRDKNTSLDELVAAAQPVCAAVVCYGEAGPRFFSAFEAAADGPGSRCLTAELAAGGGTGLRCFLLPDFLSAFRKAVSEARPGQAVLLSPACASFDEFSSYEQRGRYFKELVSEQAASGSAEGGVINGD